MKTSLSKILGMGNFHVFIIFSAVNHPFFAYAKMTLSDKGTGINRIVTIESTDQFRLVFEAADNWGLDPILFT
jgi:hypothetical protein